MTENESNETLVRAAGKIAGSRYLTAFTGAGVSVESGIPPFRGPGGLWNRYDPQILDLDFFTAHPEKSWPAIRALFYDFMKTGGKTEEAEFTAIQPNRAHLVLAAWEKRGLLKKLITQNIDDLLFKAGSRYVIENHGNCRTLVCMKCGTRTDAEHYTFTEDVPRCACGGVYKPDFIFFGEAIPHDAMLGASDAAGRTDCMVITGTSGAVYPAAGIPPAAKSRGALIIEINPEPTEYTHGTTDIFIPLKAGEAFARLEDILTEKGI